MSTLENPYVAIVARKHRNLKKKLEKILKLEANVASGKVLDEEQFILYSSKGSVEKAIADIGGLKEQLEEVYVQELAASNDAKEYALHAPSRTEEVSTETLAVTQSSASTQCEEKPKVQMAETASQIEAPVHDTSVPVTVVADDAITQVEHAVRKLLKVFHVCMKYGAITGQSLPANVDFFGKTLLGQTSIAGFDVALEGSLRTLGIYLNEELAQQSEFVRGFTYSQMADFVDALAYDCTPVAAAAHSFVSLSVSSSPAGTATIMSVVDSPLVVDEPLQPEGEAVVATAEPSELRSAEVPAARSDKRDTERKRKATPRERLPRPVPDKEAAHGTETKRITRAKAPKSKKETVTGDASAPSTVPAVPTNVSVSSSGVPEKKPAWGNVVANSERHMTEGQNSSERPVPDQSNRLPRKEGVQTGGATDGDKRKKIPRERRPEERKGATDDKRSGVAQDSSQPKPVRREAPTVIAKGAEASSSNGGGKPKLVVRNVAGTAAVGEGAKAHPQDGPSRAQRVHKPQAAAGVGASRAPPREPRVAAPKQPISTAPKTAPASATTKK